MPYATGLIPEEQRTRILNVHVGVGPLGGGAAERNYRLAAHLLAAQEYVSMLMTDKWLVNGELSDGYAFPRERLMILPLINDRYDIPLPMLGIIDRAVEIADVIHIIGYASPMVSLVCAAARRKRKPWVVCTAGLLPLRGRSLPLKKAFQAVWGQRILRDAARLIAITVDEMTAIAPYASSSGKVVLLPNAVDVPPLASDSGSREPKTSHSSPYLLFMGGFHPTKGADLLIDSAGRPSCPGNTGPNRGHDAV
ncbi:MAG: glycosyltransferase [Acidobacteriota bacterium]